MYWFSKMNLSEIVPNYNSQRPVTANIYIFIFTLEYGAVVCTYTMKWRWPNHISHWRHNFFHLQINIVFLIHIIRILASKLRSTRNEHFSHYRLVMYERVERERFTDYSCQVNFIFARHTIHRLHYFADFVM